MQLLNEPVRDSDPAYDTVLCRACGEEEADCECEEFIAFDEYDMEEYMLWIEEQRAEMRGDRI